MINSRESLRDDKKHIVTNGVHYRISNDKVMYDSSVLDECIEEIKHSQHPDEHRKSHSIEPDYRIISWFWYYFFQFGAALGNEIFYILFFPIW